MKTTKKNKKVVATDIHTIATSALSLVQEMTSRIPLDTVSSAALVTARAGNLVSDEVMTIAASVVEANPDRFPDIDATAITNGLAYEQAVTPLVTALKRLTQQVLNTVQNRRGSAASAALQTYQVMKTIARVSPSTAFPTQQKEMETLLSTRKKARATSVTKTEAAAAVKAVKTTKVTSAKMASLQASANELGVTVVSSPPTSGTAGVPAASAPPATH